MASLYTAFQTVGYTLENGVYTSILAPPSMKQDQASTSCDEPAAKKKRIIDPFDPEATVPLPFQLDDQFGPYSSSIWKRNERERCRVRCVNEAYEQLRHHLPLHHGEKRLSKVDTLRFAIRYINHLNRLLKDVFHQYSCHCFAGFQEESEGNVQVNYQSLMNKTCY
ncbi:unnamed protein product [Caenorhabditis bovis]|uniref:BHLH domain-containing protein n=1 Tax=Caenorhabditis bovis TaxID=2654633 RepID=A0A8S1ETC8_9PELO|nr:unnamed protein product [Caenorhabditis bovis]